MTSIKIGLCLSLSGTYQNFGHSALLCYQIWEESVNLKGGLLGNQVELVYLDDESKTENTLRVYNQLLDIEKVDIVIGGHGSPFNSLVVPMMSNRQKFFLSLLNKPSGHSNCFSMLPVGTIPNIDLTADFFNRLSSNSSIAIVAADLECTKNLVAGAKENVVENSHRLVFEHYYSLLNDDLKSIAEQLKLLNPDAIFIASYASDSLELIKAFNDLGFYPKDMGVSAVRPLGLRNMYTGLDDVMEQYISRAPSTDSDLVSYYMAPMAYAQLQVLEQAINATNSLNDLLLIEFTKNATFSTVLGEIKFDNNGECNATEMLDLSYKKMSTHSSDHVSQHC